VDDGRIAGTHAFVGFPAASTESVTALAARSGATLWQIAMPGCD